MPYATYEVYNIRGKRIYATQRKDKFILLVHFRLVEHFLVKTLFTLHCMHSIYVYLISQLSDTFSNYLYISVFGASTNPISEANYSL